MFREPQRAGSREEAGGGSFFREAHKIGGKKTSKFLPLKSCSPSVEELKKREKRER